MRVLLATLEYPPFFGGVSNYYDNLVKHWPEQGGISVLDNSKHELVDERRRYIKWLPALRSIRSQWKLKSFDHLLVGQILPLGIAAYYLSKIYKFEYSVIIHGMDFTFALKTPRKKQMATKIMKEAKYIICTNGYTAKLVEEFLGQGSESKVFIINPGIDPNSYEVEDDARVLELRKKYDLADKFVLLTTCRLVKRKGIDQVILALSRLADRWPKLAYVIAGTGPDEAYVKSYAESLGGGFSRVVKFVGVPNDFDKWQLIHLADAFIMTSREIDGDYEGFGIVYLEAGLASKPVIAGASGGVADAVENEVNGLMVDPNDSVEIAQAIEALIDHPELGKKLGKGGRERAEKLFMWKVQAEKFYKIFN